MKKLLVAVVLVLSAHAFSADVDQCSVYAKGNTKKVTRMLKEILAAKKYTLVDDWPSARYGVTSGREECSMPIGCGLSQYNIYFYTPSKWDDRPGIKELSATYRQLHRADAFGDFEAGLVNCPDAI